MSELVAPYALSLALIVIGWRTTRPPKPEPPRGQPYDRVLRRRGS